MLIAMFLREQSFSCDVFDGLPRDSGVGADKYVGNPLKIRGTAPGLRLTVFLSTLKLMKKILMKIGYLEVQLSF